MAVDLTPATSRDTSFAVSADPSLDYQVRDLALADAGRHQIRLAEHEMPGLMALRREHADSKP